MISKAEARTLRNFHDKVFALLSVDDFTTDELARSPAKTAKKKAKRAAKKKSTVSKRATSKQESSTT